jgi:hypothetical protein
VDHVPASGVWMWVLCLIDRHGWTIYTLFRRVDVSTMCKVDWHGCHLPASGVWMWVLCALVDRHRWVTLYPLQGWSTMFTLHEHGWIIVYLLQAMWMWVICLHYMGLRWIISYPLQACGCGTMCILVDRYGLVVLYPLPGVWMWGVPCLH